MLNQRSIPSEQVVRVAKLVYSRVRKEEPAADAGNERFGHWPLSVQIIKRVVVIRPGVYADRIQIGARARSRPLRTSQMAGTHSSPSRVLTT